MTTVINIQLSDMIRQRTNRKLETHSRIVDEASRAIRRGGYAGVSVGEVMKAVGLTHGGFYNHFESRDALLVEAIEHAAKDSFATISRAAQERAARGVSRFRALVETYLTDGNLGALDAGCPVAALASEIPRQSAPVREASTVRVRRLFAAVAAALPQEKKDAASTVTSTLVGTLQLARSLGDSAEGRELLSSVRLSLLDQYDTWKTPAS